MQQHPERDSTRCILNILLIIELEAACFSLEDDSRAYVVHHSGDLGSTSNNY